MKTVGVAAVWLVLAGGCAAPAPLPEVAVDGQVLVVLSDAHGAATLPAGSKRRYGGRDAWPVSLHTRADARAIAGDHRLHEIYAWPIGELGIFCIAFQVPDDRDRDALIRQLNADPRVHHAQAVNAFRGMLVHRYDDPLFDVQYREHKPVLEALHAATTGEGVRLGIVDGYVDSDHDDLRGQIAAQVPPGKNVDLAGLRHGTAVAGVIAASAGNGEGLVGLAPGATVSVYAGCRQTRGGVTQCSTISLAEAIERAIEDRSDVINLSIAGPPDWLLERLLAHARAEGAVLIAAHNPGDQDRRFPGILEFVHTAGPDTGHWFAREEQFSTRAGGGYQVFFGSSMSAAGVSGMATLLRSKWPGDDADRMLDELLHAGCLPWRALGANPPRQNVAHEDCAL